MKKLLIAVDGSDCSSRALRLALEERGGAEVHLVTVQPPVKAGGFVGKKNVDEYHREEGMRILQPAIDAATAAGATVQHHICVGEPGPTIARFATQIGADRIVVGSKGRGALPDIVLGSAVRSLLEESRVPVLVVK